MFSRPLAIGQSIRMQTHLRRELTVVQGYLELGMHELAWDALVKIDVRYHEATPYLRIRVDVCHVLERWDIVAEVTRQLAEVEPWDVRHIIKMAEAVRMIAGEGAAAHLLDSAKEKYVPDAVLLYNLACYRATSGCIEEAKSLLSEAFTLNIWLKLHALRDPDLKGVLDTLSDPALG